MIHVVCEYLLTSTTFNKSHRRHQNSQDYPFSRCVVLYKILSFRSGERLEAWVKSSEMLYTPAVVDVTITGGTVS